MFPVGFSLLRQAPKRVPSQKRGPNGYGFLFRGDPQNVQNHGAGPPTYGSFPSVNKKIGGPFCWCLRGRPRRATLRFGFSVFLSSSLTGATGGRCGQIQLIFLEMLRGSICVLGFGEVTQNFRYIEGNAGKGGGRVQSAKVVFIPSCGFQLNNSQGF